MTFQIERLGHKGDGVALSVEGKPLFAQRVLPGEEVEARVNGDKLEDVRIITPSDNRVSPPCRHFKSCGGCSLQHASDGFVASWKEGIVSNALSAHGLEAEIRGILTSPPQSRRRAALSARRTKKGAMIGFHARGSDVLVETPDCQLLRPEIQAMLPALREVTILGASRTVELTLHVTHSDAGLDVDVSGGKLLDEKLRIALASWCQTPGIARLSWDGEVVVEMRAPSQPFGAAQVTLPPRSFLQATREGEAHLVTQAQSILKGAKQVLDLFAGAGTFALALAGDAEVHAVEDSEAMLSALDRGWRNAKGLKRVTTETRDLFRRPLMPDELKRFDGVVIDPPRAGAEAQVRELAGSEVKRIAMISCNPITFARDARILLDAGYNLGAVQPVDQFRWSPHIELCADFTRT